VSDKPLHVKVAEALGLRPKMVRVRESADLFVEVYSDNRYWLVDGQHSAQELAALAPPRYDKDWSVTGPLIERLRLALWCVEGMFGGASEWRTNGVDEKLQLEGSVVGPTALEAVCRYILAMREAGKL
jgi:hypothetical protein